MGISTETSSKPIILCLKLLDISIGAQSKAPKVTVKAAVKSAEL